MSEDAAAIPASEPPTLPKEVKKKGAEEVPPTEKKEEEVDNPPQRIRAREGDGELEQGRKKQKKKKRPEVVYCERCHYDDPRFALRPMNYVMSIFT
jgi:hypothetical protein